MAEIFYSTLYDQELLERSMVEPLLSTSFTGPPTMPAGISSNNAP